MKDMPTINIERLCKRASALETQPNGSLKTSVRLARRKLQILARDGYACIKCNKKTDLTIDHLKQPKRRTGASYYKLSECVTMCKDCHMKKNGW